MTSFYEQFLLSAFCCLLSSYSPHIPSNLRKKAGIPCAWSM
jgi:hypothetical protein